MFNNPTESQPDLKKTELPFRQRQEQFLRIIFYGASIIGLPTIIATALGEIDQRVLSIYIGIYVVLLIATFVRMPYWLKAGTLLALIYGLGMSNLLDTGVWGDARMAFLGLIVMATLLFSPLAGIVTGLISFVSLGIVGWLVFTGQYQLTSTLVDGGPPTTPLTTWIVGSGTLLLFAFTLVSTINLVHREFSKTRERVAGYLDQLEDKELNLEKQVGERTSELARRSFQLESTTVIAHHAANIQDIATLLDEVVNLITARFGFYHAGIFLLSESGTHAVLQAASSDGGRRMLARGHQLEVGRQGIVGNVAFNKRPRIALDVGAEAVFFNNPDLPETRSEMALPLMVQTRTIGVLDIQSKDQQAFVPEDVSILQTMADQVALAIENAQLLAESKIALSQLEARSSEATFATWKQRAAQTRGYHYTPLNVTPILESMGPESEASDQAVHVPITLRGQTIGTITMKRKGAYSLWTEKEHDLLLDVGSQIGLALENARLLEESQRRAARERQIGEITNQFSRMLNMDTLLQTAVAELGKVMNVDEAKIELKINEQGEEK
jgi:GAF domain-containing protein